MKNHNCIIPFIFSTLLEVRKNIYFIWITWLIMYHIFITFIIVSGYSHVWKQLLMVSGRMFISWTKYFNHCCIFFFQKENHHKNSLQYPFIKFGMYRTSWKGFEFSPWLYVLPRFFSFCRIFLGILRNLY